MAREITCYVYDQDDRKYATEYWVTIGGKAGYTQPTAAELDEIEKKLTAKIHRTEAALTRLANSSPFDLDVDVDERGGTVRVAELTA